MLLDMTLFLGPDMAPFMLLRMMPLMLQQGATYADIAAHGVIHVATNGVTHAAVLLMAPLILHCCHTGATHDTTHGATHTASHEVTHAALLSHRRHPCCHIVF